MPIYQYVALSKRGEKKKNLLLVDSKQDVVEELNRMGYYSISIHQIDNVMIIIVHSFLMAYSLDT